MKYIKSRFPRRIVEANMGSGPFANDVGWNDSFLGRFINNTVRKGRIQNNIRKVKNLIKALEAEFENIIVESKVFNSDKQREVKQIEVFAFFYELTKAVENGDDPKVLIRIIDNCIKATDELGPFKTRDEIIKELNAFKEYLLSEEVASIEQEKTSDEEEKKEFTTGKSELFHQVKTLRTLLNLVNNYKDRRIVFDTGEVKKDSEHALKDGTFAKVVSIENDRVVFMSRQRDGKYIASQRNELPLSEFKKLILPTQSDAFMAYRKISRALNSLISNDKGVSVNKDLLSGLINNAMDNKQDIKDIFTEVQRYLTGDKKGVINLDGLLENVVNKRSIPVIAEKIARFAKRSMQLEKTGLYGSIPVIGGELKTFNDAMINLSKVNESASVSVRKNAEDIKAYYDANCKQVSSFSVSVEDAKRVSEDIENEKSDEVTFTMDPIIEITRLFNRAYQLYTFSTITKRSENVGTNVLREYVSFGDDTGRKGPYRNIKIYTEWEDAVYRIMADRKYQVLFTKHAGLRIPVVSSPDPMNSDHWDIKPGIGNSFRRYILSIMNGDKIYKSGDADGSIYKFLNEYFGDETPITKDMKKRVENEDYKVNVVMADEIAENAITLAFKQYKDDLGEDKLTQGLIFSAYGEYLDKKSNSFDDKNVYFMVEGADANYIYLSYSESFKGYYDAINSVDGAKKEIDKGDLKRNPDTESRKVLYYTKVPKVYVKNLLKTGAAIELKSVDNKLGDIVANTLDIQDIFVLRNGDRVFDPQYSKMVEKMDGSGIIKGDVVDKLSGVSGLDVDQRK